MANSPYRRTGYVPGEDKGDISGCQTPPSMLNNLGGIGLWRHRILSIR